MLIWDVRSGELLASQTTRHRTVLDLAFSPDGKRLGLLALDKDEEGLFGPPTLRVLEPTTGATLYIVREPFPVQTFAWTGDSDGLIVAEGVGVTERLRRLVASTGAEKWRVAGPEADSTVVSLVCQPGGDRFAFTATDARKANPARLHVHDAITGAPRWSVENNVADDDIRRLTIRWTPDGRRLVRVVTDKKGNEEKQAEFLEFFPDDPKDVARFPITGKVLAPSVAFDRNCGRFATPTGVAGSLDGGTTAAQGWNQK